MRRASLSLLFLFFSWFYGYSQAPVRLSLNEAISLAQKNSLDYKIAANIVRSSYWNYQNFTAGFLPKLSLNGNLPEYYRSINSITLPDGQISFVAQDVASSSLYLNLSQNIGLTGGSFAVGSSLSRIDNYGDYRNTSYTAVPLTLSYVQGGLFYNDFKWRKKIEPLRLQETQREYLENLENISNSTVSQYFDLLIADSQYKLDQQNLKNIDTLVKITQSRFDIGTVQLNDVLQSKVSLLNARTALAGSRLALETARQNLVRYLNMKSNQVIELEMPDSVTFFEVSSDQALKKAENNRKFVIEFRRRRLEAEQAVARTKAQTGPVVTVRANIGLTQTGNSFDLAYKGLLRNQSFAIGLNIPLIDWGVNKSNRKRAEANLELENSNIAQQELSYEQEIYYQIVKWEVMKEQIAMSDSARSLARQRYDIARQKYALGSISFTDFNNAQLDKDLAVTAYMNNLREYWSLYYLIRKLTLFDFERNRKIEFEDIVLE